MFFLYRLHRKLASLVILGVCFGAFSEGFSFETLSRDLSNEETAREEFDRIQEVIAASEDPLAEGKKFFKSFIKEINQRHGLNLTVPEACKLVRDNLDKMQLPIETQGVVLETIEFFESETSSFAQHMDLMAATIDWSKIWPFSLFFKEKKPLLLACQVDDSKGYPSDIYVGGCEILVGILVSLLPIPGSTAVGMGIIGDGTRRVISGVEQFEREQKKNPDHKPSSPFSFEF